MSETEKTFLSTIEIENIPYDVSDIAFDAVKFVASIAIGFGWMLLMLLIASFISLGYVHFEFKIMLIISAVFAVGVAVFNGISIRKKYKKFKELYPDYSLRNKNRNKIEE